MGICRHAASNSHATIRVFTKPLLVSCQGVGIISQSLGKSGPPGLSFAFFVCACFWPCCHNLPYQIPA